MKAAVPVLAYRNISPVSGVTPSEFSLHLDALASEGWRSISASELVDFLKTNAPLRQKPYLITFDDAYLDNWVYAMPILRRHGVRAAFGCVTAYLHDAPPRPTAASSPAAALHALPTARDAWDLAFEDNDFSAFMSRPELRALVRDEGHELLGHTHTHQLCFTSKKPQPLDARASDAFGGGLHGIFLESSDEAASLPSGSAYACNGFWPSSDDPFNASLLERTTAERIDFCTREFALCRERIEDLAQAPSRAMIWPCGQYDDVAIQTALLAGYEAAFSSAPGANLPSTPIFALRRIAIDSGTPSQEILRRLALAVNPIIPPLLKRFFQ